MVPICGTVPYQQGQAAHGGDIATALLAISVLLTVRVPALFWPILYVPLLLITHGLAIYLLLRPAQVPARSVSLEMPRGPNH
jgi:hypothetical protein